MPVIPALRRLRQEVKASLGHSENLSQKNKKETNKNRFFYPSHMHLKRHR
jgi:hypothetical protein